MKVHILKQPFLIYSGNLLSFLYNDKDVMKKFKVLYSQDWGTSVIAIGKITSAVNTTPNRIIPVMEYGVTNES
jgi:hypothetical protein